MESNYIAGHLPPARGAKKSADLNLRSPDGYGLLTPGDYLANGNSFVFPSLGVAAFVGLIVGFRATVRLRVLIFAAIIASLGFWILVPEGWWAKAPPTRMHVSELLTCRVYITHRLLRFVRNYLRLNAR